MEVWVVVEGGCMGSWLMRGWWVDDGSEGVGDT